MSMFAQWGARSTRPRPAVDRGADRRQEGEGADGGRVRADPAEPWVRADGSYDLSLPFTVQLVGLLCTGLRRMAAGDYHASGDAFNEAARRLDRACCDAERFRHLSPVESISQVRELVLTFIPSVVGAAELVQEGRHDEAFASVAVVPAALWKVASFLYEESSRRYGAQRTLHQEDAFGERPSARNQGAIRAALEELLHNPAYTAVCCHALGDSRVLRFEKVAEEVLVLSLARATLDERARRRADVFFANMEGEKSPAAYRIRLGRDPEAGARLAVGVFDVVFDLDEGYDLSVELA